MGFKDRLVFFDNRTYAEAIRMLYYLAGVEFEDERIAHEDWPKCKSSIPLGQVPVLYTEKGVLNQRNVIARYTAKRFGLAGKDLWEETLHDLVLEDIKEITEVAVKVMQWRMFDAAEPDVKEDVVTEKLRKVLEVIESVAKEREQKFIVGPEIGLAEVQLYTSLELISKLLPEVMSLTPWTEEFVKKFKDDERIQKYLSERPESKLGI